MIRPLRPEDRPLVERLVRDVWGEELLRKKGLQWKWLHEANPHLPQGQGSPGVIALADGLAVGLFRSIPVPLQVGERTFSLHWNVDLMIHPAHRHGGLAVSLTERLFESGEINAGLPLEGSATHRILQKLNGRLLIISRLPRILRPLRFGFLLPPALRSGRVEELVDDSFGTLYGALFGRGGPRGEEGIGIVEVKRFGEGCDRFLALALPEHPVTVYRSSRYLNWRFVECPEKRYDLFEVRRGESVEGYMVLREEVRRGIRRGYIVDLMVRREGQGVLEPLLRFALARFRERGMDMAHAVKFFRPPYAETFRRAGFLSRGGREIRVIAVTVTSPDVPRDILEDPVNWFLTREFAHQEMD